MINKELENYHIWSNPNETLEKRLPMVGSCLSLRPPCSPLEVIPLLRDVVNCEKWIIMENESSIYNFSQWTWTFHHGTINLHHDTISHKHASRGDASHHITIFFIMQKIICRLLYFRDNNFIRKNTI
jgi:hypothetical protein